MQNSHKVLLLCMAAGLLSCSHEDKKEDLFPRSIIYSPSGEPLNGGPLGHPTCEAALSGWVMRVSSGSGFISKEVFLADAHTQFVQMDIDHNGYLVSEELDRYREPYRQDQLYDTSDKEMGKEGKRAHDNKGKSSGSKPSIAADPYDPVMSADTNLDFKVTPDEFMHQANDVFLKLDQNHDGLLSAPEVLMLCPKRP